MDLLVVQKAIDVMFYIKGRLKVLDQLPDCVSKDSLKADLDSLLNQDWQVLCTLRPPCADVSDQVDPLKSMGSRVRI